MMSQLSRLEKLSRLESACEFYLTGGKCNGAKGNCQICPLTDARRKLMGRAILDEDGPATEAPKAPNEPEYHTNQMCRVGRFTMNWKEVN